MSEFYDHRTIEEKWQQFWAEHQLFQRTEIQEITHPEQKMYLLYAFAYPSGSGLHVGHVEPKTALDILARFHRMNGKQVFFPVGWDAFGLPAENYAIKTGIPPAETTAEAIKNFSRQVQRIGISYDWANEIATCDPSYYRWTQWLFLQLYQAGLAYQGVGMVNWCPSCQTVLANEQVVSGRCERCDSEVVQKEMKQWFFKITDYQDELISGLDQVDWPEPTKQQQLNWIGKKEGAEVSFEVARNTDAGGAESGSASVGAAEITCFTTRLDTIFGVSFLVLSPEKYRELGLAKQIRAEVSEEKAAQVATYVDHAFKRTEEERQVGENDKTGVDTGLQALNPVSGELVPIWVADYVLGGYGTGAVMGVPAHDARDWAFAKKHGLEIKPVIESETVSADQFDLAVWQAAYAEPGRMINSGQFDGLTYEQAREQLSAAFPDQVKLTTNYKLRDWLISRQRYWGAPIPIVYDPDGQPHPVKEEHLPWLLPTDVEFKPTGESPLKLSQEFKQRTEELYGKGWTPEYDTMDTFVDSSWYYLRYADSGNSEQFASAEMLEKWQPVDFYMIGPEHVVLHLLYSRFFTKFLRDQGHLNFDEPFLKLRHQGMILGPDGKKMSKSKGNVINPDDVIEKFGADTLRVFEMFLGPIDADKPWDINAVAGVYRFLQRVNQLVRRWQAENGAAEGAKEAAAELSNNQDKRYSKQLQQKLHQTIKKVTHDLPELKFNTAIAAMMELVNVWENEVMMSRDEVIAFIKILAPLAPFLAEELYHQVGGEGDQVSVHLAAWPVWDESLAQEETIQLAVQVNGKVRGQLAVARAEINHQEQILTDAKALPELQKWLLEGEIVKELYISGKIVSFVVKPK